MTNEEGFMTPFMRFSRNAILSTVCLRDFTVSSNHLSVTHQTREDSLYRLTSTAAWFTALTSASRSALRISRDRKTNEVVMMEETVDGFGYPSLQTFSRTLPVKTKRC